MADFAGSQPRIYHKKAHSHSFSPHLTERFFVTSRLAIGGFGFPFSRCRVAYLSLAGLVGANLVYWAAGKATNFPIAHFYAHWIVDLILITLVVYGLGGARVPFSITPYLLIVITSSVFMSRAAAWIVASGGAAMHAGLVTAEQLMLIESPFDLWDPQFVGGTRAFEIVTPIAMILLIAYISGTLANDLKVANVLLAQRNLTLRDQNTELAQLRGEVDFQARILTHDVRSPLVAISGALAEIRRGLETSDVRGELLSLIDMAEKSADRIDRMIDALSEAREATERIIDFAPVEIGAVIAELEDEFRWQIECKRAHVVREGPLPTIMGARQKIVTVFRNLLANALRYVPSDGTGLIKVGMVESDTHWQVFVVDNGCGIPRDYQGEIFGLFRKCPQPVPSPGFGMGLAIVKRICDEHRAKVWVESDGKTGSCFYLAFPKALVADS